MAAEEISDVGSPGCGGELVRAASVGASGVRIGCMVKEQLEEVVLAAGFECPPDDRCAVAVVVAVAAWVGPGCEQDPRAFRIAVAHRGRERLFGDRGQVR